MTSKGSVSSDADPCHGLHGGTKPPRSTSTTASTSGASKRRTRRGLKAEQPVLTSVGNQPPPASDRRNTPTIFHPAN